MAKGKPLSAAHKAAISAGLKRYWASKRSSSTSASSSLQRTTFNIDTGKAISREEAARRMFGTAGAAKKIAAANKKRRR